MTLPASYALVCAAVTRGILEHQQRIGNDSYGVGAAVARHARGGGRVPAAPSG